MAKIKNIFDGGVGKLGNLVLYKRNGVNVVRVKPAHIKVSTTPAQQAQKLKFRLINKFLFQFSEPIRVTFTSSVEGRTALHEAQSYNLRHAVAGEYPDFFVDKAKVLLSQGPLALPVSASVSYHPDGFLVQWENAPETKGNNAHDNLVVFIMKADGTGDHRFTEARRSYGQYVWKALYPFSEDALPDVWIAFRNPKMTRCSNSIKL